MRRDLAGKMMDGKYTGVQWWVTTYVIGAEQPRSSTLETGVAKSDGRSHGRAKVPLVLSAIRSVCTCDGAHLLSLFAVRTPPVAIKDHQSPHQRALGKMIKHAH